MTVASDHDGDLGINTATPTAWRGDKAPIRLRISRSEPDQHGAQHLVFVPYEYGMSAEYPGVVEWWVREFSIHGPDSGHSLPGSFWVGDEFDLGGAHATAHADREFREAIVRRDQNADSIGEKYSELASETFLGTGHGSWHLVVRGVNDGFVFLVGRKGFEVEVAQITAQGELRVKSLGVGNAETVEADPFKDTLGTVVGKTEVFDAEGNSLGFIPIYDQIN